MPAKYVGLMIFIWVVASIMGGVMEQQYLGTTEAGVLNGVMGFNTVTEDTDFGETEIPGPIAGIKNGIGWLSSLWALITFQFAFIYGPWIIVKWIILFPIIGIVTFGLITMFFSMFRKAI